MKYFLKAYSHTSLNYRDICNLSIELCKENNSYGKQLMRLLCVKYGLDWCGCEFMGKLLDTPGARKNGALFSHIHGGPYHKFNERTPSWIWEEWASFSILREYLRITRVYETSKSFCTEFVFEKGKDCWHRGPFISPWPRGTFFSKSFIHKFTYICLSHQK